MVYHEKWGSSQIGLSFYQAEPVNKFIDFFTRIYENLIINFQITKLIMQVVELSSH